MARHISNISLCPNFKDHFLKNIYRAEKLRLTTLRGKNGGRKQGSLMDLMDALSAFDRDTSSCTVDKPLRPLFTLRYPLCCAAQIRYYRDRYKSMAHPSTFYPRRTRILAQRNARREFSRTNTFQLQHISSIPSCPSLFPSPSLETVQIRSPRSTNLHPTPSVFGYPYRDSNSGLIEGLCVMKDRNPTLRPLSAVLSIFHLYYHISGIRNPFFSRNSGSLLTTSRYGSTYGAYPLEGWIPSYAYPRPLVARGKLL